MKRVLLLLVVLFAWYGFASGQSSKAKDGLQAATNAALSYAQDAQLVAVQSVPGSSVNVDGTCPMGWAFCYMSFAKDSTYLVEFNCGRTLVYCNSAKNSMYNYSGVLDVTGTTWLNSDSVAELAEDNGGEQCRAENENCMMILCKGLYTPDTLRTVWDVIYSGAGGTSLSVLIDPLTGEILSAPATAVHEFADAPSTPQIGQNYPNPFGVSTSISFTLGVAGNVTLAVYDQLGRYVSTLASGRMEAGAHSVAFDASNLPEGMYFYKLSAGGVTQTRRMAIIK
ncbi:MAG TPA: T9SS type A sorting domain-containing protein [Candidatus Kapabacteria bacterium]|nr:T9SS type A sorting domain-containing protein [Candidatus Kapabacteria bacterium]